MELSKIADGKLQEAFDKSLNEVLDACVQWGRKVSKDGTIVGAVQIALKVEGAQGGCASISDFAVSAKMPPRVADCWKSHDSATTQPPAVDERQLELALVPVAASQAEEVWASFEAEDRPKPAPKTLEA